MARALTILLLVPAPLLAQDPAPDHAALLAAKLLPPGAAEALCRQLASDDAALRLSAFAVLWQHSRAPELRAPLNDVLQQGGEARQLAALLLARLPRADLPLPPGWQRASEPPPQPEKVDLEKATAEQLVAICRRGASMTEVTGAAQQLAFRCSRDQALVPVFLAAIDATPVEFRGFALGSAAAIRGDWVRALFPKLCNWLRTNLCGNVEQFFHQQPVLAAEFAPLLVKRMEGASLADAAALAWYLGRTPVLMRPWADTVAALVPEATTHQRMLILNGFTGLDASSPVLVAALRTCAGDQGHGGGDVRRRAFLLAAQWRCDDEGVLARARVAAAGDADAAARKAARMLLTATGAAFDAELLAEMLKAKETSDVLAALRVLKNHDGELPPALFTACTEMLRHNDDAVFTAAAQLMISRGELGRRALLESKAWGRELPQACALEVVQALLACGSPGVEALVSMLYSRGTRVAASLDRLGDAATPVYVALARRIMRAPVLQTLQAAMTDQLAADAPLRTVWSDPVQYLGRYVRQKDVAAGERRAILREVGNHVVQHAVRPTSPVQRTEAALWEELLPLLRDDIAEVRAAAADLLFGMSQPPLAQLREIWLCGSAAERAVAGGLLRRVDPEVRRLGPMPVWLAPVRLLDPALSLRSDAITALVAGGREELLDQRLQALLAAEPELAPALLSSLSAARVGVPVQLELARRLVTDPDREVRRIVVMVAFAAGKAGDGVIEVAFAQPDLREQILDLCYGYGRVPPALLPAIAALTMPPAGLLQQRAVQVLFGGSVPPVADPGLRPAAEFAFQKASTAAERSLLLPALAACAPDLGACREEVVAMLADARVEVRRAAILALAGADQPAHLVELWRKETATSDRAARVFGWRVLAAWRGDLPQGALEFALAGALNGELPAALPGLRRLWPKCSADDSLKLLRQVVALANVAGPGTDGDWVGDAVAVVLAAGEPGLQAFRLEKHWSNVVLQHLAARHPQDLLRLALLVDGAWQVRLLRELASSNAPDLVPALLPLLRDGEVVVRCAAAAALHCGGPAQAGAVLAWAKEEGCTPQVVDALAAWGNDAKVFSDWLLGAARALPAEEQQRIVHHLVGLGRTGVSLLATLAASGIDVDAAVRMAITVQDAAVSEAALRLVFVLQKPQLLDGIPSQGRSATWRVFHAIAMLELRKAGPPDLDTLALALQTDEALTRRRMLKALAGSELPVAGWALVVEALEDPDRDVRLAAARALAHARGVLARLQGVVRERLAVETDAEIAAALTSLRQ